MIVKKYWATGVSGYFDPYILYNRLKEHYPDITYYHPDDDKYVARPHQKSFHPLEGVKISNIFKGSVIEGLKNVNEEIKVSFNVEIFSERIVAFEMILKSNQYHDIFFDEKVNLLKLPLKIKDDNNIIESSFHVIIGDFLIKKLFEFTEGSPLMKVFDSMDPTDERAEINILKSIKEKLGLFSDGGGAFEGINTGDTGNIPLLIYDKDKVMTAYDKIEKLSDDKEIYKINLSNISNVIYTQDKTTFSKYIEEHKKYFRHLSILKSYYSPLKLWLKSTQEKSDKIIDNLNNNNEIYWRKLRSEIEQWQLLFLNLHTHIHKAISQLDSRNNYKIVNKTIEKKWNENIDKTRAKVIGLLNEIKYALENIATPGHTHDEQLLQRETEKVNERILLLSFLAMSIPMVGAILSPSLESNTKIYSATILVLLPLSYIIFRKISYDAKDKSNTRKQLLEDKKDMSTQIDHLEKEIQKINKSDQEKLSKEQNIDMLTRNIGVTKQMIEKINKKL